MQIAIVSRSDGLRCYKKLSNSNSSSLLTLKRDLIVVLVMDHFVLLICKVK